MPLISAANRHLTVQGYRMVVAVNESKFTPWGRKAMCLPLQHFTLLM